MPINLDNIIPSSGSTKDPSQGGVFGSAILTVKEPKMTPKAMDKRLTGNGRSQTGLFHKLFGTVEQIKDAPISHQINQNDKTYLRYPSKTTEKYSSISAHLTRGYPSAYPMFMESKYIALNMMNTTLENNIVSYNDAHVELPAMAKSLMYPQLHDLAERRRRFNMANAKKAAAGKAPDAWTAPKTLGEIDHWNYKEIKDTSYDMYTSVDTETIQLYARDGAATAQDPNPKQQVIPRFSLIANITLYPKNPTVAPEDMTAMLVHVNHMNQQTTQLTNALSNVVMGTGFVTIRIPVNALYDTYKVTTNKSIHTLLTMMDTLDTPKTTAVSQLDAIMQRLRENVADTNLPLAIGRQIQVMKDSSIDYMLDHLSTLRMNVNSKDPDATAKMVTYMHEALAIFAQYQRCDEDWMTTNDYNRLYHEMKNIARIYQIPAVDLNALASSQLRLMMSQNLYALSEAKDTGALYKFNPTDKNVDYSFKNNADYSTQQKDVITSPAPLITVSAGAGSGKSHTLIGRLRYLKEQGEDLSKVMVLSFTNVAAENILQRYPNIKSLTLGNLFNQMYHENYPSQELSSTPTFANALSIINPQAPVFKRFHTPDYDLAETLGQFRSIMSELDTSGYKRVDVPTVTAKLASFIGIHFEEVVALMDALGQTTLDLQPIIIHNLLLNRPQDLKTPADYQDLNFIITDESQDISTFEYILLLTLAVSHKANMMITGDGSQTLFEFRNASPLFLNAIEASGVFESFRLTTNYRSDESILMFANQFLQVIDANKYARIQLQSNNFSRVTQQVFDDAVKIQNNMYSGSTQSEYEESVYQNIVEKGRLRDWIEERITNKEQIAIMSFTHGERTQAEDAIGCILKDMNRTDLEVTNITPPRKTPSADISRVVSNYKASLAAITVDAQHAAHYKAAFRNAVMERFKDPSKAFVPNYVIKALDELFQSPMYTTWLNDTMQNNMTTAVFNGMIIQHLINAEIRHNSMISMLNKEVKDTDYDNIPLITTTIHSSKGLEFDNVLVIFNEARAGSTSQENLRLFGVALTRARHNQFILNTVNASKTAAGKRVVSNLPSGMFSTPMETAYMRCDDIINNRTNQMKVVKIVGTDVDAHEDDKDN